MVLKHTGPKINLKLCMAYQSRHILVQQHTCPKASGLYITLVLSHTGPATYWPYCIWTDHITHCYIQHEYSIYADSTTDDQHTSPITYWSHHILTLQHMGSKTYWPNNTLAIKQWINLATYWFQQILVFQYTGFIAYRLFIILPKHLSNRRQTGFNT